MTRSRTLSVFLFLSYLAFTLPAFAEWHPAEPEGARKTHRSESRSDRLARELGLTKAQKDKWEALTKTRDQKIDKIYKDFRERREVVLKEYEESTREVLTPAQREKYVEIRQQIILEKASRMGDRKRKDKKK